MPRAYPGDGGDPLELVRSSAMDSEPIKGLTHCFYRYPARFSPAFARGCIQAFSGTGGVVLDPFMGGGTTVLEAMLLGRRAIGSDVNALAVFVANVKITELTLHEKRSIETWAEEVVPALRCSTPLDGSLEVRPKNMGLPSARWLRKTIALCLAAAQSELPTAQAIQFVRCVLLNVGQWALNGRKRIPSAKEFRERVIFTTRDMLSGTRELTEVIKQTSHTIYRPLLCQVDAEQLDSNQQVSASGLVDLVVTSPPYPGIHMLYHRWQVDGRKETDAPFWIAACSDGAGAAFYNFADRKRNAESRYFEKAMRSFSAIRRVMHRGGMLVQMVAFSEPERQLTRYLNMLEAAGFSERCGVDQKRIWREVPGRKWHANFKGVLASSREVVLLHEAI